MKKVLIMIFVLGISLLCVSCDPECIENPVDDGEKPFIDLAIIYNDACGDEQIIDLTSEDAYMEDETLIGHYIDLPIDADYAFIVRCEDGGGVRSATISSVEFAKDADLTILEPYHTILEKDYSNCALEKRYVTLEVDSHADKYVHYEIIVRDFANVGKSLRVLIRPILSSDCQ